MPIGPTFTPTPTGSWAWLEGAAGRVITVAPRAIAASGRILLMGNLHSIGCFQGSTPIVRAENTGLRRVGCTSTADAPRKTGITDRRLPGHANMLTVESS